MLNAGDILLFGEVCSHCCFTPETSSHKQVSDQYEHCSLVAVTVPRAYEPPVAWLYRSLTTGESFYFKTAKMTPRRVLERMNWLLLTLFTDEHVQLRAYKTAKFSQKLNGAVCINSGDIFRRCSASGSDAAWSQRGWSR